MLRWLLLEKARSQTRNLLEKESRLQSSHRGLTRLVEAALSKAQVGLDFTPLGADLSPRTNDLKLDPLAWKEEDDGVWVQKLRWTRLIIAPRTM